jgi:hypothetical protein
MEAGCVIPYTRPALSAKPFWLRLLMSPLLV